jgi:hypothetical protein
VSVITKMRKQSAIYWARSGTDSYGQPSFAEPVEITCRWDDSVTEFIDPQGERRLSSAVVYVDRDMPLGSMLKLGDLDSNIADDPRENADTFEVRQFAKNPNFKATEFLRTVYL